MFLLLFAACNFPGPMLLGPLFDTLGRRVMITVTHAFTDVLSLAIGHLFLVEGFARRRDRGGVTPRAPGHETSSPCA